MKLAIAITALLGIIFTAEGLQHITRNPAKGHRQYRFAVLEDGDYNSYVDTFLAELSKELRVSGDSVPIEEDFGHFIDSGIVVDYLFKNGVFLGLSNISRASNVTYEYDEEQQLVGLYFNFAYTDAQANFDFSIRIDNGPQYDGSIEDDVSTETALIDIIVDLATAQWVLFATMFPIFDLDNSTVTWVDDTYANLSDNVTESSLEALLLGSSAIHEAIVEKLETVLENVGLPPQPEM